MTRAKTETVPWNIQDHISNPERQLGYLEAAFEDGDPALIAAAIGDVVRARGATEVAKQANISREAIYKAFDAQGNPTLSTMLSVLKALNFQLKVGSTGAEIGGA